MSEELETIKESAKAAQKIAKTTGQVVGAGQKLGQFVAKFIKGPLEQASGIIDDKIKRNSKKKATGYQRQRD